MAMDHYAPCPCGSGKKLKFCKCVDNPQDFEKLVRLIEGGQEIAALDRINQLLKKTPNAAWLLALKGELNLGMQEIDSFRETAKRFLKLKPDNPLALIMTSVANSIDGEPPEVAARHLLQGMAESRESLPAMALTGIQMLMRSMAARGRMSMVGYWADVFAALTGNESQEDSVLHDPNLNLIAKAPAKIIEDPPGSPWKERLAEVIVLARSFRYEQAETKLQSILRDFPGQPGPLSHLLRAKYAQLDQPGAQATARKLAEHREVSPADRAYFAAVAMELEPERAPLLSPMDIRYCEVDSEVRLAESLSEFDWIIEADGESSDEAKQYFGFVVQDEVPAKRIFNIYDRELKPGAEATADGEIASTIGTIVTFSKQTDKPARALLLAHQYAPYQPRIDEVLQTLDLGEDFGSKPPIVNSYSEFLNRPRTVVGSQTGEISPEQLGPVIIEEFLNCKIATLEGQTPLEAAEDEPKRATLLGILSHIEGEQSIVVEAEVIDEIYKRLNLERPQVAIQQDAEGLKLVNILDLERIDITKINAAQLRGLMIRGMSLGATRVCYRCAKVIVEKEELADDKQLQVVALSNLLATAPSLEAKLDYSQRVEAALAATGSPVGRVILQRMSIMHAMGQHEAAQNMMMEALQKYPEDPYLLSFMQYAMQGGGAAGGGGRDPLEARMMQGPPAAQSEGGLVLPGQESTPAGGSGESKLWLPGS